jgi:cytidylate kinase
MDTGLLYRRVGAAALADGVPLDDAPRLAQLAARLPPLGSEAEQAALRSEEVGTAASRVSAVPAVRAALLDAQRAFAESPPAPCRGGCECLKGVG